MATISSKYTDASADNDTELLFLETVADDDNFFKVSKPLLEFFHGSKVVTILIRKQKFSACLLVYWVFRIWNLKIFKTK